ncbi:hypothetical protein CHUAL_007392 [Chamberlinius hualienensis]
MNCSCGDAFGSYERLSSCNESTLELDLLNETELPKAAELSFYNDDGSYKTIVVEENLRAVDLCQLLALKNHVAKDVNWSVVLRLEDLGLERSLEDHEEVLPIFISWERGNKSHRNKFYFRKDFRKYEFFHNPQQFFPDEMAELDGDQECLSDSPELSRMITLQTLLANTDKIPEISDVMWVKEIGKQVWRKAHFVLSDRMLYFSYKSNTKTVGQMQRFADVTAYRVYISTDGRKCFKAPSEFCFCLKPILTYSPVKNNKDLLCFCCETDRARYCWVTAMRIAIYGSQIRHNFKSFKLWQDKTTTQATPEYISQQVPLESVRTRVAMDFTGSNGKVIEDPLEAEAVAIAEGRYWNKKRRPFAYKISGGVLRGLDSGVHVTQPWFHSGLTREEATSLLTKYGTVDGVFLVRNSQNFSTDFVLSFIYSGKVIHTRISLVEEKDHVCYSLDNGRTKFYDLLQLVEFYQLNLNSLPTKLTHYIVPSRGITNQSPKELRLKSAGSPQD